MESEEDRVRRLVRREQLKDELRQICEQTIDARVDRYLEIDHQGITGAHHFAPASAQCIDLYRDGYFMSAVMVSQSVNEAIVRFVAERSRISRHRGRRGGLLSDVLSKLPWGRRGSSDTKTLPQVLDECLRRQAISASSAEASKRILGSFRADVHHLNPTVANINFPALAKRNLEALAMIEKDIFGVDIREGMLNPHHPEYWDIRPDGTVGVYLRLS